MTAIPLADGYWDEALRSDRIRLFNMMVVENKASPTGFSYRGRPGLAAYQNLPTSPVQKVWRQEGTLGGAFVTVAGGVAYKGFTALGAVGAANIDIAGGPDRAVIVADGKAWRTDGETLALIVMPDDVPGYEGYPAPVSSVRFFNGFFLLGIKGTQRFYWIIPGEDDPDALDFASAERTPDNIVKIAISGDEIWFLGGEGEEVWTATGDEDAPYQRITGRVYENGCADGNSVCEIGTALFWVTKNKQVVAASGSPTPVSDEAIDLILADDTSFKAWDFKLGGHPVYVLTTGTLTLPYDVKAQRWSRFGSYGHETWRAACGAQSGPLVVAGDSESGQLWTLDFNLWSDAGDTLIREISGAVSNTGPPMGCASVSIRTSVGQAPTFGDEIAVELKWSDNQGATFSPWRRIPLGLRGNYDRGAVARSCGQVKRPGRTFVWRFTANAPWRVDYARMNEA